MNVNTNLQQLRSSFRQVEIQSPDERLREARKLDKYQKKALHVAVKFAMDVIISRKGKIPYPKAPFMMIHGGAGHPSRIH